jgi:glutathione synthase/RimK-type ligase-like ATP-grasp enzyme
MKDKFILVISSTEDEQHIAHVQKHVERYGYRLLRVDTDRFGIDCGLTLLFDAVHCPHILIHAKENDLEISEENIQSVWFRKPRIANFMHYNLSSESRLFIQDEWIATLKGFYRILQEKGVFFVSDPDSIIRASYKPFQLLLAAQLGWRIPQTTITSNPDSLRSFWFKTSGKVIAKPVGRGWVTNESNPDEVFFVMTNEIHETDLECLSDLTLSPVTFQENVPKDYEIRATVVGQQVFSVSIDSQRSERSRIDWRRYDFANTPYKAITIPELVKAKCLRITQQLGLEYGAIDLIKTPADDYVFLEINPVGQFLWLEHLAGVPISEAIARLLIGLEPPLQKLKEV